MIFKSISSWLKSLSLLKGFV